MEQFNTIPTSGNWSDIAGILDANFFRCYTALVQSESLVGLSGSNFQGIYTSASALPDEMSSSGWALVGSSLSALTLYVYNTSSSEWGALNNVTYNFTDFSEFQNQLDALSSQLTQIGLKLDEVAGNFQVRDLVFDQNAFLNSSGNIESYAGARATSEYYPINDNIQYTIVTGMIIYDINLVCFYDVNKNFISGYKNADGESFTNISLSSIVSIPSNAVFVRFSFYTHPNRDYQIKIEYSPFALKSEMQECEQNMQELEQKIDSDSSDIVSIKGIKTTQIPCPLTGFYDITNHGSFVSYNLASASNLVEIDRTKTYLLTANAKWSIGMIAYFDEDNKYISGYPSSSQSSEISVSNTDINELLPIPSNAFYVGFSSYRAGSLTVLSSGVSTDYKSLTELEHEIDELSNNTEESIDVVRTSIINSESFERIPFVNDSFLSRRNGTVQTLAGYCATDFVAIDKNKIYAYRGSNVFDVANIAFYDDSQVFISALPTSSPSTLQSTEQIFYPKDFPNNAKYIRFGARAGVALGFPANVVCCYPANINIKTPKRLITKTMHFIGDSVMIGREQVESVRSLTYFLQEKYGLKCINHGAGGAILTSSTLHYAPIYNQLTSLSKDADYIIMQGGLNGISQEATQSAPWGWGEISDSFETNFDTVLQIPCLEAMCKYVVTTFPNKKWGFIINYQIGSYDYWQQKSELIKQVLDKWGIPYLDWRHTGINLASNAIREKYGVDSYTLYPQYSNQSTYNLDDRVIYDGKTYKANTNISTPEEWEPSHWDLVSSTRYDSWHCNALAYEQLADKTYDWIRSL